ncbi:MAG: hypothetical protein PHE55_06070 [Methylococcaceae bacterium]|nr:hypothetical protein [Methylococcaceae bacterium]
MKKISLALAATALVGCVGPGPYPRHPDGPGYSPGPGDRYEGPDRSQRPPPPDRYNRDDRQRPPRPDYYNRDDRRSPPPPNAQRWEREDDPRRGPGPGRPPEDD